MVGSSGKYIDDEIIELLKNKSMTTGEIAICLEENPNRICRRLRSLHRFNVICRLTGFKNDYHYKLSDEFIRSELNGSM